MTTKQFQQEWTDMGCPHVIGIDEAGRGPLAGPVVAAAVFLPLSVDIPTLRDSKKMTAKQRESCFVSIVENGNVGIGLASPAEIDRVNILQATFLAMMRAVDDLVLEPDICLVDGNHRVPLLKYPQQTLVRGDQRSFVVAAASVIAKVTRDRIMIDMHKLYPQYGFSQHKGYPTKAHKQTLAKWGPSPIHRLTFAGAAAKEFSQ